MAKERMFNRGRFEFIGDITFGKEPIQLRRLGESNYYETRLSVGIKDGSNINYLATEYIHEKDFKSVKLCSKDDTGVMLEVPNCDTSKPETLEMVADFTKIVVDLETDFEKKDKYVSLYFKINAINKKVYDDTATEEDIKKLEEYKKEFEELSNNRLVFCHMKDVIAFLNSSLPALKDKKIRVKGDVKSNFFNNKNRLKCIPNYIEIVPNDTPNKSAIFVDLFYEKDSIEDDKDAKKVIINGWIGETIKKQEKFFPLQAVIDYTKIDLENEQHLLLLDVLKDTFEIKDKKQIHKMGVELKSVNGAEVVEFTEDCLSEKQKMQIKVGIKTLEDFKPKGNTYGEKVTELKVMSGDYKNYPDGSVEAFEISELGEYLATNDSNVKIKDVKKEEKKEDKKTVDEDTMRSLFG